MSCLVTLYIKCPELLFVRYDALIMLKLYCKTHVLQLRWDTGTVRHRFGGIMIRLKDRIWFKGRVNSVIIDVITKITDVITCMYF